MEPLNYNVVLLAAHAKEATHSTLTGWARLCMELRVSVSSGHVRGPIEVKERRHIRGTPYQTRDTAHAVALHNFLGGRPRSHPSWRIYLQHIQQSVLSVIR